MKHEMRRTSSRSVFVAELSIPSELWAGLRLDEIRSDDTTLNWATSSIGCSHFNTQGLTEPAVLSPLRFLVSFYHHELNQTVKKNTSLTSRRAQHRRLPTISSYGTFTASVPRSHHELPEHKPDLSLMWNTPADVFVRDSLLSDPVDKRSHKRPLTVFPTALSSCLFASPNVHESRSSTCPHIFFHEFAHHVQVCSFLLSTLLAALGEPPSFSCNHSTFLSLRAPTCPRPPSASTLNRTSSVSSFPTIVLWSSNTPLPTWAIVRLSAFEFSFRSSVRLTKSS